MKVINLQDDDTIEEWGDVEEMDELELAIAHAKSCKEASALANTKAAEANAKVIKLLQERGERTASTHLNGGVKVTLVEAERLSLDEAGLIRVLDRNLRRKLQRRKVLVERLDKARLEEAVHEGLITAEMVAEHSKLEANRPYIRITEQQSDGD